MFELGDDRARLRDRARELAEGVFRDRAAETIRSGILGW